MLWWWVEVRVRVGWVSVRMTVVGWANRYCLVWIGCWGRCEVSVVGWECHRKLLGDGWVSVGRAWKLLGVGWVSVGCVGGGVLVGGGIMARAAVGGV